jgi:drug/metabolite transporter (DMT)-like permease
MTWFSLSLLAAFISAIISAVDKLVLVRWQVTPALMTFIAGLIELIAACGVWLTIGLSEMPYSDIGLALCAGVLKALMTLFFYLAVAREEVSRIATLFTLTPLFILLFARFALHESLQPQEYLGVILLVSGAMLITCKDKLFPQLNLAFCFAILGILCLTVNQIIIKSLLETTDYWTVFSYARMGVFLAVVPLLPLVISNMQSFRSERKGLVLTLIATNNAIAVSGVFVFTAAVALGSVTLVNAIGSVFPLFLLLIVIFVGTINPNILREELDKSSLTSKSIAILLLVCGTIAISGVGFN